MIQIEQVIIRKLSYHQFYIDDFQNHLNQSLYDYKNEEEKEVIKKIFLKPFLNSFSTYEFTHDVNINYNPLYNIAESIHSDNDFNEDSLLIYKHLKSVSKHPNIKNGDLFILKYEGLQFNNKYYEGLGVYKIENKESFITTNEDVNSSNSISFMKGISSKK